MKSISACLLVASLVIVPSQPLSWTFNRGADSNSNSSYLAFGSSITPLGGVNSTVALLQFEQNTLDSGPFHNNGQVTGNAQYTAGKTGAYAFSFDGSSHIALPNPSQFAFDKTNPFTISFWVKMSPNNATDMYLVSNSKDQNSVGVSIWESHLSNSLIFKMQNNRVKTFQVSSNFNVADNNWHLLLFSYDGSSNQKGMGIYIDGALQAVGTPSTVSGTIVSNNAETIGSTVSGSMPFKGTIDNLQVLNYLLTPSALQSFLGSPQLFAPILYAPIPTTSGVSLSWPPVIGAVGYDVYRNGVLVTSTLEPSASYFDSGLLPSTSYAYNVVAVNVTGGSSAMSKTLLATTTAVPANSVPLRAFIFSPNISSDTLQVLKASYQPGDGIMATRVPYAEQFQDSLGIAGLKHFILAPRITSIDPSCNLGPTPSFSDFVAQSQQAKAKGYDIEAIIYDIEGWCWTPQIEQTNYVSYIDQAAQLAHAGGFKSAVVPTHSELLQWYPNIHWNNIDYLIIQFQKQIMTKNSNYTLEDPQYYQDVSNVINFVKSKNPNISIIINYSSNWEPTASMIKSVSQFASEIQGVNMYDLPPNDPNNIGSPYPGYNTPSHQDQFLKAIKSIS